MSKPDRFAPYFEARKKKIARPAFTVSLRPTPAPIGLPLREVDPETRRMIDEALAARATGAEARS